MANSTLWKPIVEFFLWGLPQTPLHMMPRFLVQTETMHAPSVYTQQHEGPNILLAKSKTGGLV